jgi:hypothetical protein
MLGTIMTFNQFNVIYFFGGQALWRTEIRVTQAFKWSINSGCTAWRRRSASWCS